MRPHFEEISQDDQHASQTASLVHPSMISSLWRMHTSIPTETSRRIENMTWRMMGMRQPPTTDPPKSPSTNTDPPLDQVDKNPDLEKYNNDVSSGCIECGVTQSILFYETFIDDPPKHDSQNSRDEMEPTLNVMRSKKRRIILCSACVSFVLSQTVPLDNDPLHSFLQFDEDEQ